jgi:hypothetical protein
MPCLSCGCENPAGMSFCEACGTKLIQGCPSCGQEVGPAASFCGHCGTPLPAPVASPQQAPAKPQPAKRTTTKGSRRKAKPQAPLAQRPPRMTGRGAPEAERRQLTVLFCDLVGSTPLAHKGTAATAGKKG